MRRRVPRRGWLAWDVQGLKAQKSMHNPLQALQEETRSGNEKWRALLAAAPVAIIALDLDGRVTSWNPAAERLFDWSAAEVIGRSNPIVPVDRRAEERAILDRAMKGEVVSNLETQRRRKDGTRMEVSLWTTVFHDDRGRIKGVFWIFSDLTEPRREHKRLDHLTTRQREILQFIAGGKATKEIAFDLNVSPKTVEFHRVQLMNRLNIHNVPGLVRYAVRSGLVSLDA